MESRSATVLRSLLLVVTVLAAGLQPSSSDETSPTTTEGAKIPVLQQVNEFRFDGPVGWFLRSDVSLLYVYAGNRLHVYDLLNSGAELYPPLEHAGLMDKRHLIPFPSWDVLIVRGSGGGASYAYNPWDGTLRWKGKAVLQADGFYPFYDQDVVVIKSLFHEVTSDAAGKPKLRVLPECRLTGIHFLTGDSWYKPVPRPVESTPAGLMLSSPSRDPLVFFEPVFGKPVWQLEQQKGMKSVLLGTTGRIASYNKKGLKVFEFTPPGAGGASVAQGFSDGKILWEQGSIGANKKISEVEAIGEDRLLVRGNIEIHLLDASDGRTIWTRPKQKFRVSPDKKSAIAGKLRKFTVVDVATGKDIHGPVMAETFHFSKGETIDGSLERRIAWLDDRHVQLIAFAEFAAVPHVKRMGLFDLDSGKEIWAESVPKPPKYALTKAEKWAIARQAMLGAVGSYLGAAWQQEAVKEGDYKMAQSANDLFNTSFGFLWNAVETAITRRTHANQLLAAESASLAARRYNDRMNKLRKSDFLFLTGDGGNYRLVAMNPETGEKRDVASWDARGVHEAEVDDAYGLVVSVAENRNVLRIHAVSDYRPIGPDSDLAVPTARSASSK